jgi:hypothetical protein
VQTYNLEMILAIGYGVRSARAVQFRQWVTTILREYLVKGFALNDQRLKHPDGHDYFDELLARVRDIRASEKPSRATPPPNSSWRGRTPRHRTWA